MGKERKYPEGYKPNIHLVSCKLRYCNENFHSYVTHKDPKVRAQYAKKITSVAFTGVMIVLDDDFKFPTKILKEKFIKKLWSLGKISMKWEEAKANVKDIKIISSHGKVSYNFDELKH
jgi:hypothetical protein